MPLNPRIPERLILPRPSHIPKSVHTLQDLEHRVCELEERNEKLREDNSVLRRITEDRESQIAKLEAMFEREKYTWPLRAIQEESEDINSSLESAQTLGGSHDHWSKGNLPIKHLPSELEDETNTQAENHTVKECKKTTKTEWILENGTESSSCSGPQFDESHCRGSKRSRGMTDSLSDRLSLPNTKQHRTDWG